MRTLLSFAAVAAVVTITPGAATALVVRSTLRGGRRRALRTIIGNEVGVLGWALLSALSVSVVVTASRVGYEILRIGGATVLAMAGMIAVFDLAWYTLVAAAVARVQRGYRERFRRWTERLTGGVLIALGARMALERR